MEHIDAVRTIPEVAITLVGFIGIVFALGHRPETGWSSREWLQVYAMTAAPLTAFFCAFAPDVFATIVSDPDHVWRLSNVTLGSLHLANVFPFLLKMSSIRVTPGQRVLAAVGGVLILSHFLAALGVIPWLAFVFIIGLLQQLFVGIFNFYLFLRPPVADAM